MDDDKLILIRKILTEINDSPTPMVANILSLRLCAPQASIGRLLQYLDYSGYLHKVSNKGRVLTDEGRAYLSSLCSDLNMRQRADELITITRKCDKKLLLDILNTRLILERETAFLAAQNIGKKDVEELEQIVNRQENEKQLNSLGENEDLEFHKKIAALSGNKILEQLLFLILTKNDAYRKFSYIRQKIARKPFSDHRKIIEALQRHDGTLASQHMTHHIAELIEDLTNHYK